MYGPVEEDLIDEDELLDESELVKPDASSLKGEISVILEMIYVCHFHFVYNWTKRICEFV